MSVCGKRLKLKSLKSYHFFLRVFGTVGLRKRDGVREIKEGEGER
jgi:hypothetical protein